MRTTKPSHSVVLFMLFLLLLAPYSAVSSRSVHQTNTVEIFPEGDFTQPSNWTLGAFTSFSEDPATYTDAMVADQRLTMVHHRPLHQDSMTFGLNPRQPIRITQSVLLMGQHRGQLAPRFNCLRSMLSVLRTMRFLGLQSWLLFQCLTSYTKIQFGFHLITTVNTNL